MFSIFSCIQNKVTLPKMLDLIFLVFFAILPFHVLFSVFGEYKLGIPGISMYKEGILALLGVCVGILFLQKRCKSLDRIDLLIGLYIVSLVGITLLNGLSLTNVIYGGRYDFEFFIAFFLARKAAPILEYPISRYIRIFLYSASAALVFGILVRFVFGEQILLHFGFSGNLSNWMFGGSIPIYHGIDGENVRRFQGIFDGPNPAGYFIIVYLGVLAFYTREKKKYHYLLSLWSLVLIGVLLFTYSRSAMLGLATWVIFFLASFMGIIWKKHRKSLAIALVFAAIFWSVLLIKFESAYKERASSTKGHFDRVIIGLKRFTSHPLGAWLATSGPAYRYVKAPETDEWLFEWANKTQEDYYIPESWYVQQLVEWGILGFAAFMAILWLLFLALVRKNIFLASSFLGVLVMNAFLHSFESIYISLLLFLLIGLVLGYEPKKLSR